MKVDSWQQYMSLSLKKIKFPALVSINFSEDGKGLLRVSIRNRNGEKTCHKFNQAMRSHLHIQGFQLANHTYTD